MADSRLAQEFPERDVNSDAVIDKSDFDAVFMVLHAQYAARSASQTSNQMAEMEGSTQLTGDCDALEITLALERAHLQDLIDGNAPAEQIVNVQASIASLEAQLAACGGDDDDGSGGTTGGTAVSGDYFVKDYKAGVFHGRESTSPVFVVREGEHFRIEGHIDGPRRYPNGPIIDPPTLTLRVDKNFDHDFLDAGETINHDWNGDSYSGYFDYSFAIDDDGTSPGDGSPTDDIDFKLTIDGNTVTDVAPALNVAPGLTSGSSLHSQLNNDLDLAVTVSSPSFLELGQLDEHTLSVKWGDGITSPGVVGSDLTRVYPLSPGSPKPVIYPVTIEIADDDTGVGKYRLESMSVGRNDDDDDDNAEEDRNAIPGSPDEDDSVALDLSDIIANRPESDGTIYLDCSYTGEDEEYSSGSSIIRLWGDAMKTTPIGDWDFYKGWELPEGLTSVWVEGIQYGEDMVRLWWEAEELVGNWESQRQSPYQGYRIALGSVDVDVRGPDVCNVGSLGANRAPIGHGESFTALHGQRITGDLIDNDFDPNGDSIQVRIKTEPQRGHIQAQNGPAFPCDSASFSYMPIPLFFGADQFTYTLWDGVVESETVTVTFNMTNDPPTALNDATIGFTSYKEGIAKGNVLSNDSDPDGDFMSAAIVPGFGPFHGIVEMHSDGSFVYVPNTNSSIVDSFAYAATDGMQLVTASVIIQMINDKPVDLDISQNGLVWESETEETFNGIVVDTNSSASIRAGALNSQGATISSRYLQWDPSKLRIGTNVTGILNLTSGGGEIQIDDIYGLLDSFEETTLDYHLIATDGFHHIQKVKVTPKKATIWNIDFTSDHGVLRDETKDIHKPGGRYNDIEVSRRSERSEPFSHTFDRTVVAKVNFEYIDLKPGDSLRIQSDPADLLAFDSTFIWNQNGRGFANLQLESLNSLPKSIEVLTGDIRWKVSINGKIVDLYTTSHEIFLTMGSPRNYPFERGDNSFAGLPTYVRMRMSVLNGKDALASSGSSASQQRFVYELMRIPEFDLEVNRISGSEEEVTAEQQGLYYSWAPDWIVPKSSILTRVWQVPTGADCISIVTWTGYTSYMLGVNLDLSTDRVYVESVANWDKGATFVSQITSNQGGYVIPLMLAGRGSQTPNQFEAVLIVPGGPNGQYFYAPGQTDSIRVHAYTSYDDVLHGSFLYPFWMWGSGHSNRERNAHWKDLTDTGIAASQGNHLYGIPTVPTPVNPDDL